MGFASRKTIWYNIPSKWKQAEKEGNKELHMGDARALESSEGLYMTVEQYLVLDESSDAKYEYLDGYAYMLRPPSSAYDDHAVLDMAGGSSPAHAALCARMIALLENALSDGPCMPYTSDAMVKVDEQRYFYPDVTVACGEQDEKMLKNPVVVIEVLSPSTEKRDRGAKFKAYKRLPSLQEYVLILCATALTEKEVVRVRRLVCPACSFIPFLSPKVVVVVAVQHRGKVLLGKRDIEPGKGLWNFCGGYVPRSLNIKLWACMLLLIVVL
jgi:Uma2 family endonuclease